MVKQAGVSPDDRVGGDLSEVVSQARQAYENNDLKNCMTLTAILLQADPDNAEAHALQSAIRSAIDSDLQKTRELLGDPRAKDEFQIFGRRAEIILRKILNLDPENEEAKALFAIIDAGLSDETGRQPPVVAAPSREAHVVPPVIQRPSEVRVPAAPTSLREEPGSFRVIPPSFGATPSFAEKRRTPRVAVFIAGAIILVVIGIALLERAPAAKPQNPGNAPRDAQVIAAPEVPKDIAQPIDSTSVLPPLPPAPGANTPANDAISPKAVAPSKDDVVVQPQLKPPQLKEPPPAIASAKGTLAVSSRGAAEIYEGDKYLGSTPATVELTAGTHTLEYRHQNLRKVVTHVIRSGETTASAILFEITVQINARPWANVSIEGSDRRSLGQTPFGEVRVPVGGTLIFENPNFKTKTYLVTGNETAIQVVFP